MHILLWTLIQSLNVLFWLWIVRWGGAERLEGTFASGFLVSWLAPRWSADGIKLFGWLMILGAVLWYVIGLANPGLRIV